MSEVGDQQTSPAPSFLLPLLEDDEEEKLNLILVLIEETTHPIFIIKKLIIKMGHFGDAQL